MQVEQPSAVSQRDYAHGVDAQTGFMTSKVMETRYYEGCGRQGPIRCIFLGEFHPVAGPKVSCQVSFATLSSFQVHILIYGQI